MRTLDVERLAAGDYALIKPLLVELHLSEQVHYIDHPQLPREEIERHLAQIPTAFRGENLIFVVRDEVGQVVGFCWIVLYDPGTGLEGEVAELFVAEGHRGRGIGEMLVRQATRLFASFSSPKATAAGASGRCSFDRRPGCLQNAGSPSPMSGREVTTRPP